MTSEPTIVVVGSGYAGVLAATRAAKRLGGRGQVYLVSPEAVLIERIRMHEHVVHARAVTHPLERFLEGTGVTYVCARVTGLDAASRTITLDQGMLRYDGLVITVGSEASVPEVPGVSEHAFTLDPGRAAGLSRALASAKRVVICGAGLTGVELATELAEARPEVSVTLLTAGELAPFVSVRGRAHIRSVCARLGIAVREGVRVEGVHADRVVASGEVIAADVVVWTAGFRAPRIVRELGLRTNALGQALVSAGLEAAPYVFVAGDAAAPPLPSRAVPLPMGCKTALPQGTLAADNVVRRVRGEPLVPFTFTDSLFCISLGRHDGLIQRLSARGETREQVLTGRAAARLKELVCRSTIALLLLARGPLAAMRAMMRTGPHAPLPRLAP